MDMTADSLTFSQSGPTTANTGTMEMTDLLSPLPPLPPDSPSKENSRPIDSNLSPSNTLRRSQNLSQGRSTTPGRSGVFPSMTLSEQATHRRLEKERTIQVETLQRQMEILEQKNIEQAKSRRKLTQDLDQKIREVRFYEKQVYELQSENQHLKHQLESTIRVSSGVASISTSNGVVGTLSGTKRTASTQLSRQQDTLMTREAALMQELRQHKEKIQELENLNKEAKESNSDLTLQVKILQDALSFRSEEIGLAGHADLLAKVAKLKGEVSALKHEIIAKAEALSSVEQEKVSLAHEREYLQEEINKIQQRLAQAQQDTYKYATQDVASLLKATEQERDLLIEYIQTDMEKSTKLAKQVEELEGEVRQQRKKVNFLEEKLEDRKQQIEHMTSQCKYYEEEYHKYHEKYQEVNKVLEQMTVERDSLLNQVQRLRGAEEDLLQQQVTLLSQLQCKDEELLHKSEELIKYKTRWTELDHKVPIIDSELVQIRSKNGSIEKENHQLKSKIQHDLEPQVKSLENQFSKLSKELEEVRKEKMQLTIENQSLSQTQQLLDSVLQDLERVDQHQISASTEDDVGQKKRTKTPKKSIPTTQTVTLEVGEINPTLSASQQHSLWIGLPSLRNLNPLLYDRIRSLAHDLYTTEQQCNTLTQRCQHLQTEYDTLSSHCQEKISLAKF